MKKCSCIFSLAALFAFADAFAGVSVTVDASGL